MGAAGLDVAAARQMGSLVPGRARPICRTRRTSRRYRSRLPRAPLPARWDTASCSPISRTTRSRATFSLVVKFTNNIFLGRHLGPEYLAELDRRLYRQEHAHKLGVPVRTVFGSKARLRQGFERRHVLYVYRMPGWTLESRAAGHIGDVLYAHQADRHVS